MAEYERLIDGRGETEVVVDLRHGVPAIVHLGAPLGQNASLPQMIRALERPIVNGTVDAVAALAVVPEHGSGFTGRPGLTGRRGGGRAWAPRFELVEATRTGDSLCVRSVDPRAGLELVTTIAVDDVVRVSTRLTNVADRRYSLDSLTVTVPLPESFDEILSLRGRWSRELHTVRESWPSGTRLTENRRGRTSHEAPPVVFVGHSGFGEWNGEVVGAHLAWSGNHQITLDRLPEGQRYLQAGELLHPGEMVLEPGDQYATPELLVSWSDRGLTPTSWGFHRAVRAHPSHPTTVRPVIINTWEAVYFDHDLSKLKALASTAADLGVERFVLDDGWFGSRRDDTKGLGDWWVSDAVYPDGLQPLIEHVTGLGMEFGIWVEPEMVNPDSDVFRAHPDWALRTDGYEPVLGRQQLVLDLGNPEAFTFIHDHLHALLRDHDISYVKWDMNRDHVQGSGRDGAAGSHAQTLALYRLLDQLRAAHPHVEIESCASGGGRIDHEILKRTERVWTSDCNDALERQRIQRGASMFIPPEVMGAHIGPTTSHTTGRTQSLAFRAITALFGHLGVEWNVTTLTDVESDALRRAIAVHKEHRELLHSGETVRFDTDPSALAHGVYAPDRSVGLVAYAQLETPFSLTPPPLRLPDLDPDAVYRVSRLAVTAEIWGHARRHAEWLTDAVELTGRQLAAHGVRPPTLHPESAVVLHLQRV
ncbi:MAG: alpha-galactosidase [Actinomycetota bacterium]